MCFTNANPSTCTSTGGSCKSDDYVSGGCVMVSGKKKRNVDIFNTITKSNAQNSKDFYQENHLLLSINENVTNFHSRRKRSVDDSLVRQITCQGIWDNTAGYWSYQYEVPKYCFSKNQMQLTNIPYSNKLEIAGINCTKGDIEALTNSYSDVELLDFVEDELWFEIEYK